MARASSIEQLPADILEQLQTLLRDPRVSQLDATAQINAILEQLGTDDRVSKSAVNRYAVKMKDVGAKLQQSRELASMWIGKLGAAPQGQVGKLVNEIIRTMAFDSAMHMAEGDTPVEPKMLAQLALAVQRLESAANMNEEREKAIRAEAANEAAATAEKSMVSQGMSQKAIDSIKTEILGLG
ncbi:DUF3486 family protein [Methylophaga thiooxydans]|uniref:Mu-like prophage FluMu protein gp27 n=1 Tax=Methylophaga thiooxydans DMS010 TaxID=637616 RepID=C0N2H2_9GAMM|nr:DUF3486 family protein [Methylophaga thiooxydans]EEF78418.1 hypothetical protein MDMS009_2962 [Methylophaga thiooxydans DMS010]EEF78781.1 hypothetical protein MDMS009_2525 [Methylophaga thiooxydans DMS010]EEF78962.1 hypothetical protein MDMS009_2479 [Methylophaga thiooxydans DMS010]EEF79102.1 hypothetical protein MDMS009_2362 [Methylophaga thiooxydans DMS010]EEF79742.1 hypothetical protein MDMS009_1680 [Methylophaga thiooxydans DMS010]